MTKHKWKENRCVNCYISREMRTRKLLMAITNNQPYNHYKYDRIYFYVDMHGKDIGWSRPNCIPPKTYDD